MRNAVSPGSRMVAIIRSFAMNPSIRGGGAPPDDASYLVRNAAS